LVVWLATDKPCAMDSGFEGWKPASQKLREIFRHVGFGRRLPVQAHKMCSTSAQMVKIELGALYGRCPLGASRRRSRSKRRSPCGNDSTTPQTRASNGCSGPDKTATCAAPGVACHNARRLLSGRRTADQLRRATPERWRGGIFAVLEPRGLGDCDGQCCTCGPLGA
jgi:hypothetical protein